MTTSRNGQIIDADRRTARTTWMTGRKWVRWTKRMKADFLDELAATCNVRESAAAIGVTPTSVYHLRRRDEAFAAGWQVALRQGYEMLEIQLVGHALAGGRSGDGAGGGPATGAMLDNGDPVRPPIHVDLALRLLREHRDRAAGKRERDGARPLIATREQTNAAIIRKLGMIEKRLAREQAAAVGVSPSGALPSGALPSGVLPSGVLPSRPPDPEREEPGA